MKLSKNILLIIMSLSIYAHADSLQKLSKSTNSVQQLPHHDPYTGELIGYKNVELKPGQKLDTNIQRANKTIKLDGRLLNNTSKEIESHRNTKSNNNLNVERNGKVNTHSAKKLEKNIQSNSETMYLNNKKVSSASQAMESYRSTKNKKNLLIEKNGKLESLDSAK